MTHKKINRQDEVDNAIFDLITQINPTDKEIEWDLELIGAIRDAIQKELVDRKICTAKQFYP